MLHASLSSKNMSLVVCLVRAFTGIQFSVTFLCSHTNQKHLKPSITFFPLTLKTQKCIIRSFVPFSHDGQWACYIFRCLEIHAQERSVAGVWSSPRAQHTPWLRRTEHSPGMASFMDGNKTQKVNLGGKKLKSEFTSAGKLRKEGGQRGRQLRGEHWDGSGSP